MIFTFLSLNHRLSVFQIHFIPQQIIVETKINQKNVPFVSLSLHHNQSSYIFFVFSSRFIRQ